MTDYNEPIDFLNEAINTYKAGHLESAVYITCIAEEGYVKNLDFIGIVACIEFIEAIREKIKDRIKRKLITNGIKPTVDKINMNLKNRCNTNDLKSILNEYNRVLSDSLRDRVRDYFELPVRKELDYENAFLVNKN